ncbi:hypothetical protein KUL25_10620 [Rhodobacteraceae bacterium N5(2021)]|uniref:DUF2946 domain-containing protein n=1 Tax=Gymnodinialimonas phycosphaerae TaxID=2841589 RepID=A0A975YE50_9RHOB|nr:hypothetical protein [Gymnodinialimonas phycosphaerae]MBY4893218.1 hypothetical protein [Gymnodinialimonas phycosphaerae]
MIRRALLHMLLALSLVLSGLTSVVAETRMAAAGGYCGIGTPQLLLDAAGLPLLDADGTAVMAPDCPACHLTLAILAPTPPNAETPLLVLQQAAPLSPVSLTPRVALLAAQARAPPHTA